MNIWHSQLNIETINSRNLDTMGHYLGIEFTEIGEDYLIAKMPITAKNKQPIGIMHGGASCVLAETVGSNAANFCVDLAKQYCVGLDINTNHLRAVKTGYVTAIAKPFHLGKSTQVWGIDIFNEEKKLVSVNRLTMAILNRK